MILSDSSQWVMLTKISLARNLFGFMVGSILIDSLVGPRTLGDLQTILRIMLVVEAKLFNETPPFHGNCLVTKDHLEGEQIYDWINQCWKIIFWNKFSRIKGHISITTLHQLKILKMLFPSLNEDKICKILLN